MPEHLQILKPDGTPAEDLEVSMSGGETSGTTVLDIWNDKEGAFLDAIAAVNLRLKLLTSIVIGYTGDDPPVPIYAPFQAYGDPVAEGRWGRARITHSLTAAGASTSGASSTHPIGTNSDFPLPDLEPATGVRVELYFAAPTGETADATKVKLSVRGRDASFPLEQFATLAHGSGVVPPDRIAALRALTRGGGIVADDSDTIVAERGQMVYEGSTITFPQSSLAFTLADADAVNLGAGEQYLVTMSRTASGALVATKGPKTEAVDYPDTPEGNVFAANLTVESADGVTVTVSASSVIQTAVRYHGFMVRPTGGLTVSIEPGDGVTSTDFRQRRSAPVTLALDASATSRVWRLADGTFTATVDDDAPEWGADLLAIVTTDAVAVTAVVDVRAFAHRALVTETITLRYVGVLSEVGPTDVLAWEIVPFDCEVEEIAVDLAAADGTWSAGSLVADLLYVGAGAALAAGVTLFTSFATDDRRPSIAYDATVLRAASVDHEVRRLAKGERLYFVLADTVTAPAPEDPAEIRLSIAVRRYR